MYVLYIHTHTHTHRQTHVLFTYPQLEVNKGEAEGKPASTLLSPFLSHREKIFLQLDSSALSVVSFSLPSRKKQLSSSRPQETCCLYDLKSVSNQLYPAFLSTPSCRDLKLNLFWFLLIFCSLTPRISTPQYL